MGIDKCSACAILAMETMETTEGTDFIVAILGVDTGPTKLSISLWGLDSDGNHTY